MAGRIEPKSYDVESAAKTLADALRGAETREITVADASTLTGLPLDLCEPALILLGKRFTSRIRVTASGALLFSFASFEAPRPRTFAVRSMLRRTAERVLALATWIVVPNLALSAAANVFALGAVATRLPLVLEVVVMPPIAITFVILFAIGFLGVVVTQVGPVIALVLALLGLFLPIFVLVQALWSGLYGILLAELVLVPICIGLVRMMVPLLLELRSGARHVISDAGRAEVQRFFAQVAGFLLGPPPSDADGLDDERRVVAFLRAHDGVLTTADVMALLGCARDEAEREVTRILADYGGTIEVMDDALVFRFDALMRSRGELPLATPTEWAWERTRAPRFFDVSVGKARAVLFAAALALAGLVLHPDLVLFPTTAFYAAIDWERSGPPVQVLEGLGAWPFVLPAILLVARLPLHALELRAYAERTRLLALLSRAYTCAKGFTIATVDSKLLLSLGGTIDPERTSTEGELHLVFDRMQQERRAARAARRAAPKARASREEIVFDSEGTPSDHD